VAGAGPNYMKVKPVMDALEARGADVILVHTDQNPAAASGRARRTGVGHVQVPWSVQWGVTTGADGAS
jgi:hypothetical protein